MDYLQQAISEYESAKSGHYNDTRDAFDSANTAALIAIVKAVTKLADAAERPTAAGEVLEMRPSVVELPDGELVSLSDIAVMRPKKDEDGEFTVVRWKAGQIEFYTGEKATHLMTAYRAYAGLDAQPDATRTDFQTSIFSAIKAAGADEVELPPDGEPIPDDYWIREAGHTMDLLRDVLGDLPADMTSPAIQAAREHVIPF